MIDSSTGGGSSGPGRIRQLNRDAVLRHIRLHGPASRTTLIRALNLSGAAVSSLVSELIADNLLRPVESAPTTGRLGRPVSLLELCPEAAYTLGLVLRPAAGRVRVEAAWADYAGGVEVVSPVVVDNADDIEAITAGVHQALSRLESSVPDRDRINAVAVGIPGVVDVGHRVPIAPRLRCIEGEGFIDRLRARVPYAMSFQNDINLAAMAELYQQPRLRTRNFAYLFIATGVGAGIGLRGQIWAGRGWAGEVGQLRLAGSRGRRVSFEERLGTDARLADEIERLGLPRGDLDGLASRLDTGDRAARRVLERYSAALMDLVEVLNAVLDLDEIIVDFPSDALLSHLMPYAERATAEGPLAVTVSQPSVGHSAAVRGAALAALGHSLGSVQRREEG